MDGRKGWIGGEEVVVWMVAGNGNEVSGMRWGIFSERRPTGERVLVDDRMWSTSSKESRMSEMYKWSKRRTLVGVSWS